MADNRLRELQEVDRVTKGDGVDEEWRSLRAYYDDCSRSLTRNALVELGMGIAENCRPVEIPLVTRIVRRLATVYKSPATRWLERGIERLDASDPQTDLLRRVLKRMRANAVWRRIDRRRTLLGQCLVRAYASDNRKAVVLRVYDPHHVIRSPSAGDADDLNSDQAFAIKTRAGWEFWERSAGLWRMTMMDAEGVPQTSQPFDQRTWRGASPASTAGGGGDSLEADGFGGPDLTSPYAVLPARMIYAEDPNGQPWISPRQSRVALQIAVNAKANDLMALVRAQAHDDEFFATKEPDALPELSSPGVRQAVPPDTQLLTASRNPKITESQQAMNNALKLGFLAEGLPSADLDNSKTILTGAALRVQESELLELREEQLELVPGDEEGVFAMVRAVHNVHAETWDELTFDDDLVLRVVVGAVDTPEERGVEQAWAHKEIDRKMLHPIEWVARRDGVDEDEAVRRYQHTQELFERWPVKAAPKPEAPGIGAPMDIPRPGGSPGGSRAPMDQGAGADLAQELRTAS